MVSVCAEILAGRGRQLFAFSDLHQTRKHRVSQVACNGIGHGVGRRNRFLGRLHTARSYVSINREFIEWPKYLKHCVME